MKKKYHLLIKILIIFSVLSNSVYAELKDELIKKIQDTNTLSFKFKQNIANKIETGDCIIKYPKLIKCDYNDSYKKRLISNGKTLAIIQRKYKKIFYYPLSTTPLHFILDKKLLVDFINNNEAVVDSLLIKYEILEKDKKFIIFFDKNTLNLKGWKTEDIYKNTVNFSITNLKINIPVDNNLFKIPAANNLSK